MKIALDAKKAFNNTAGLGQYSRTLINGLLKNFPSHKYSLFTTKINPALHKEIIGNYSLTLPSSTFDKILPSLWRAYGIDNSLKKGLFDIYHGLSNELPLSIHKINSIKKIVTIHDVIFLKHKEQYSLIDQKFYDYKTAYSTKNADIIVAISEETKRDLMHFYSVPEKKIHVVYQSCHPRFYVEAEEKQKLSVKQKYRLPEKFILNVSSFFPRKNHRTLLEAYALIHDKTDAQLVFIGDQGSEKSKIVALIKEKNLTNKVHILSTVTNEDMPAIYQQASAFVYPSFYEGFGAPILESLNSKIPVITTKGGCFEEVGGKESLYVNPNNAQQLSEAIVKVLTDEVLKNSMIQKGIIHASTMKEEFFINNTMKLYESLV